MYSLIKFLSLFLPSFFPFSLWIPIASVVMILSLMVKQPSSSGMAVISRKKVELCVVFGGEWREEVGVLGEGVGIKAVGSYRFSLLI